MKERKPGNLIPARPGAIADGDYSRHFPWKWLILGAATLVAVVVMHRTKEQGKADRLRRDILQVHQQELGEAAAHRIRCRFMLVFCKGFLLNRQRCTDS